ncbi:unnamed protein product [Linum trigynum]|uniref:Disease resistance protein RGA3 n=1 Tax=Linum trigynum TaxID=586398 RepID=A0AAV2E2T2_9ROSI
MAAEAVLIPVAKLILGKASDLASEQIGLLWNFRRELSKFKDTVSTIQAVLRDAEEKQFHNHQVKDWLEKLSGIMYDAEDLLDDLATEARRKAMLSAATDDDGGGGGRRRTSTTCCWSVVRFLFSSLAKQLVYDLKMAHAIKAIREKLDDISKDREILHLESHSSQEGEALPSRETDSCPPLIVVGREGDRKKIIHLLLNSTCEANIFVVPIIGMGGMGKTTLAQLVFDDDQVKAHFDIKAWVYVSQSFDVSVILEKILQSIACQGVAGLSLDVLQARLRGKITGKRFLFVLDDVWEETSWSWETLGKYLTVGAPGSKVLVTTRSSKVAEVGGGALKSRSSNNIVLPYHLKGLSEEECWNLLVEKFLPRKVPQDPHLQEIGKQILRRCGGVPLAVSTIAGALVDSRDPNVEWPYFLQKGLSSIKHGEDPTMSALQLSFSHLPSNTKHCFTYCILFPKGFKFNVQMMIRFWVAQGFVESEDEGSGCFKMLWCRSFFQEMEMYESGEMKVCRMHDLMYDLACSIAGNKITRSSSSTVLINVPSKTRHLYVTGDGNDDLREEDYGDGLGNASKVRTLVCMKSLSNKELEHVLNKFLRLRVLMIVEESSIPYWLELVLDASASLNSLNKLKHLRYLALRNTTRWKKLPDSVTNLVNLQVLELVNVWSSEEQLPRDTMMLVKLKHLELTGYEGVKLPNWLSGLPNLVEFSLRDCNRCQYLLALHQMSSLKKLTIDNCPLLNCINNDADHCYSSPDNSSSRLTTEEEDDDEWPRFQCLSYLKIQNCPSLTRLPMFPTLEGELELDNTSLAPLARTMKMNMRRGGEGVDCSDEYAYGDTNIHPPLTSSSASAYPLSGLTKMFLSDINEDLESLSHPNSSSCLISVEELRVQSCNQCVKLPGSLCSSIHLMKIHLYKCATLEYLPPLHELPSLRKLFIGGCPKLKGCWWKKKKKQGNHDNHKGGGDDDYYYNFDPSMEGDREERKDEEMEEEWPHFPCLSTLRIESCPKLIWMPLFPTVEGEMWLYQTSTEALVRTMKMKPVVAAAAAEHYLDSQQHSTCAAATTTTCSSSSSSSSSSSARADIVPPLSKVTQLQLWWIDDLEFLPEEGLRNLTSLQSLFLCNCSRLASLPPAMRNLTSLQSLAILNCPLLRDRCRKGEGEDWPNISHIPEIVMPDKV